MSDNVNCGKAMMKAETMPISDLELAQASAAGDEMAFERIYRAQVGRVYSLCIRMLGNPTEAEDVTQDVFLRLYRKTGTFQGEAALSTWLYRLTVNTVLMHLRRQQRKQKGRPMEDDSLQKLADGGQLKRRGELSIIHRIDLERAIGRLPSGYRTVLVLHDIEGFEHEEIARMLSICVGTSKSQLHKARLKMRKLLPGNHPANQPVESEVKTYSSGTVPTEAGPQKGTRSTKTPCLW